MWGSYQQLKYIQMCSLPVRVSHVIISTSKQPWAHINCSKYTRIRSIPVSVVCHDQYLQKVHDFRPIPSTRVISNRHCFSEIVRFIVNFFLNSIQEAILKNYVKTHCCTIASCLPVAADELCWGYRKDRFIKQNQRKLPMSSVVSISPRCSILLASGLWCRSTRQERKQKGNWVVAPLQRISVVANVSYAGRILWSFMSCRMCFILEPKSALSFTEFIRQGLQMRSSTILRGNFSKKLCRCFLELWWLSFWSTAIGFALLGLQIALSRPAVLAGSLFLHLRHCGPCCFLLAQKISPILLRRVDRWSTLRGRRRSWQASGWRWRWPRRLLVGVRV